MYTAKQLIAAGFYGYAGWPDEAANNDYKATGGNGKGSLTNPSALSGTAAAVNSGTTQAGPINFNWDTAENDALTKLSPYYEQVLAEAKGDMEKAKQILEDDYARGLRQNSEDLTSQNAQYGQLEPRETAALNEGLNKRGMLDSTVATGDQSYLGFTQQQRREAYQRAIERRNELAGIQEQRGVDQLNTQFPRYQRDLEEEKKQKAAQMAASQYGRYTSNQLTEANRFLDPSVV